MMDILRQMPTAGLAVIISILVLFLLALIMLFVTYGKYRSIIRSVSLTNPEPGNKIAAAVKKEYAKVYLEFGENTNTPAIISGLFTARLHRSLTAERFMNAAVSTFVTLGLFGTFLGLSMSVSSLTELISLSSAEEWLSILNSVGGGLVSALSGMGLAFYTSLTGVVCAILFTILRTVFNPQAQRESLENRLELWLDHTVAPTLETEYASDDAARLLKLSADIKSYTKTVQSTLLAATDKMEQTMKFATEGLGKMVEYSKEPIGAFYDTVKTFCENTRDMSEITYELRGTVERMDIAARDLGNRLKETGRAVGGDRR